jgi:CheY-like chemotaxis protein
MFLPQRPRILVADDQRIIADTLAMILNQNGYEAVPVYGGRAAVEKARRWAAEIYISDVNMPGIDGIQAAIEICKILPGCRILLFSGEPGNKALVGDARFQGHRFEFLQKPILPLELLNRIQRLRAV